jgi:hypothetical protein
MVIVLIVLAGISPMTSELPLRVVINVWMKAITVSRLTNALLVTPTKSSIPLTSPNSVDRLPL